MTKQQAPRGATETDVRFLDLISTSERLGQVGWGTTAALLAKMGVPVQPMEIPAAARWPHDNMVQGFETIPADELALIDKIAVKFSADYTEGTYYYHYREEPAGPITLQGQEFPVADGGAAPLPQAFPGTATAGILNRADVTQWVASTYPPIAEIHAALLRQNAEIEERRGDDEAKDRMESESQQALDGGDDPTAAMIAIAMDLAFDNDRDYRRWRQVKTMRGDYLGMEFRPSFAQWLSSEPNPAVCELATDVLAEGVAYGFANELRAAIMATASEALGRLDEALRWVGGRPPTHANGVETS